MGQGFPSNGGSDRDLTILPQWKSVTKEFLLRTLQCMRKGGGRRLHKYGQTHERVEDPA
jgi:hypothetical protein